MFSKNEARLARAAKGNSSSNDTTDVTLTPKMLFREFRKEKLDHGWTYAYKAIDQFQHLEGNRMLFLEPTIQFLKEEQEDRIRSWGTSVLEIIGGEKAFSFLVEILETEKTKREKRAYLHTRFFALKAIANLANSDSEKKKFVAIIEYMWKDDDEDYLNQALASVLLARNELVSAKVREEAEVKLKGMLSKDRINEFWPALRSLRALQEFSLPSLVEDIISILKSSNYTEHKRGAIWALSLYPDELGVVRELGLIVRKNQDSYLRLVAVKSLAKLRHPDSQEDLISALRDDDAEVRVQASEALKSLLKEEAVPTILQYALREEVDETMLTHLVEALRLIDRDRKVSTQVLSKEMAGEDQRRVQLAELILLELGGWAAVQRISQRRNTLETLDRLLEQSEQAIKDTFQDTINQARRNFYFAMGVNILVVIVGLILITLAIMQLIQQPDKFQNWVVPGAAGLFGILITMFFNNPRQNAREDLTTLMNVNVIFLGFLRRLNQVDATFKYAYIESHSFGTDDMDKTVKQIDDAVIQTLKMAEHHLRKPVQLQSDDNKTRLVSSVSSANKLKNKNDSAFGE
jgi:hypothetical protein